MYDMPVSCGTTQWHLPELQDSGIEFSGLCAAYQHEKQMCLKKMSPELTSLLLLQHWAGLIINAEKPAALSSRDGRLLRRPPAPANLEHGQLVKALHQALAGGLQQHARDVLVQAQGEALPCTLDNRLRRRMVDPPLYSWSELELAEVTSIHHICLLPACCCITARLLDTLWFLASLAPAPPELLWKQR